MMITDILPPEVRAAETFSEVSVPLFPAEREAITRAVASRRREYTTVRACARLALGELGLTPSAIVPGDAGAPGWPQGVIGSMTHCAGYRAAAVGRTGEVASLGVDAEPNEPLPEGILGRIAEPVEQGRIRKLSAEGTEVCWDRLLFSAKESVYKAWYPLMRRWLGFDQADIGISPSGEFVATLATPITAAGCAPIEVLHGRWLCQQGLVLTAIVITAGVRT